MVLGLYFLAFELTSSIVVGELSCFYNYTLYSTNCYRFYSSPLSNYNDALKICRNDDADLVSIHNAFENAYVWSIGSPGILIGLQYDPDKALYQWSDNSSLDYTNYDSTFLPNRDYLGYCAQNVKGKWINAECEDDKLVFVCKATAVDIPDTPTWGCPDPETIYEIPGTLFSPGYPAQYDLTPDAYPDGCYYKLAAKNGYKLRIHIQEFNLVNDIGNIIVYKRLAATAANEFARIDKRFIGGELLLDSNVALLHLSGSYSGKWRISWSGEEPPSVTPENVCPSTNIIYTESETIYSPGYPENFEFSLNTMDTGCYYKLIAQKGFYIEINIDANFLSLDGGTVDVFKAWKVGIANRLVSFNGGNVVRKIKVDSDEVLVRVWNSHRGIYKITWRTFKSETCSKDWRYFNGSCYLQGGSAMNFSLTKSFCSSHNSHPMYIETAEEQQFLEDWLPGWPPYQFWLGLKENWKTKWLWLNFEPLTFTNWYANEPDGQSGSLPMCGLFGNYEEKGSWGDYECSLYVHAHPLCEHETNETSVHS